jgi:hypothetical protein
VACAASVAIEGWLIERTASDKRHEKDAEALAAAWDAHRRERQERLRLEARVGELEAQSSTPPPAELSSAPMLFYKKRGPGHDPLAMSRAVSLPRRSPPERAAPPSVE